ncbi:flagellin lysine-N-methylase [Clostridium sp. D53t1_180928_C8]|uniref:flagellin lysine-N-methylase n=1 Tax=Clostridium sp. D53t1_180928_C8 TaxID=2787101 RepID=UPI001FAD714F|nr:flagellin lysine-N-methylase [Clostridium sp. D53t1_180928_C8]
MFFVLDIRVNSINIIQNRDFSIKERLSILKSFYDEIESLYNEEDFDSIEELLEDYSAGTVAFENFKSLDLTEGNEFYLSLLNEDFIKNIRSVRLKECINEYKNSISQVNDITKYIKEETNLLEEIENYSYIFENYLVNQIFKDLIPFNKGESLNLSINILINSYKIIKTYTIGIALNSKKKITEKEIIRVIQSLSKDIEHNKVFKILLEENI